MTMENVQQLSIGIYGGDCESRKSVVKSIFSILKINTIVVDMEQPIIEAVSGQEGLKIPRAAFSDENIDKPLHAPFAASDAHIRDIMYHMYKRLGPDTKFSPHKVGINKFRKATIVTARDLLRFAGFEVMRTAYPDFVPTMVCENYKNKPGIFIVNNIKFLNEIQYCDEAFQLFYPVFLNQKKKGNNPDDFYIGVREDMGTFPNFSELAMTAKGKFKEDELSKILAKIEEDKNQKLASGMLKPLKVESMLSVGAEESTPLKSGQVRVGKAVFGPDKPWPKSDIIY